MMNDQITFKKKGYNNNVAKGILAILGILVLLGFFLKWNSWMMRFLEVSLATCGFYIYYNYRNSFSELIFTDKKLQIVKTNLKSKEYSYKDIEIYEGNNEISFYLLRKIGGEKLILRCFLSEWDMQKDTIKSIATQHGISVKNSRSDLAESASTFGDVLHFIVQFFK